MAQQTVRPALAKPKSIGVSSPAFENGRAIPREFSGFGSDENPPLLLTGVPNDAQALAIVVDDPDAPGGTFTHWTAWNLPATMREVPQLLRAAEHGATEGVNDFGKGGWRGPKPPAGPAHRYVFRVFALSKRLPLPANAPVADVWRALDDHALAWGELVGTFTRP